MSLLPMTPGQLEEYELVIKEYGIDIDKEVEKIKQWINDQPHLPKYLDNDNKIKNFMLGCKYSIEATKQTIDTYYSIRSLVPELYTNRDPLHYSVKQAFEISYCCPLPKLTKDAYRVVLIGNLSSENSKTVAEDFYKILIMMGEMILMEDKCNGLIIVINATGCTVQQLMKSTLPLLKKFMFCVQKGYPSRIKNIITLHAPGYFEYFINLFKTTLSKKLQDRYNVYGLEQGYKPMFDAVEADIIPSDFGGKGPSIKSLRDEWEKKLLTYRDWFVREETRVTDEKKRPKHVKFDPEEAFGMTGRRMTVYPLETSYHITSKIFKQWIKCFSIPESRITTLDEIKHK